MAGPTGTVEETGPHPRLVVYPSHTRVTLSPAVAVPGSGEELIARIERYRPR
jgi:hypothetical protein